MTRVAIVGAGILGAALAERLAGRGAAVTVLDSGPPGSGTSGSSLAWLNANQKLPRHYHDLSVRALAEWRTLAGRLGGPSWYVPTGSLTWAETEEQRAALSERLARLRDWGYPVEELTARGAAELEPALRVPDGAAVASFPAEGFVLGDEAVRALLDGVDVRVTGTDVTLEPGGSGVSAVRLPGGERLSADVYVCCAGWRTLRLLAPLGVTVPLIAGDAPGSAAPCLVTRVPVAATLRRVVHAPDLTLRPAAQGVQLEAEDVNDRVDAHTGPADLDRHGATLLQRAAAVLGPATGPARHRICIRPLPADGHPIVGRLPGLPNVYLAVTHSGMTLAPLLARLAAGEILDGGPGDTGLEPYRPARFAARLPGPSGPEG